MKYIIYIVLSILLISTAIAEQRIIETEFDVKIVPYNNSCYVKISTEDEDFDYNVSSITNYNDEEINFIRDVKCQEEIYFENMTSICTSLASQYSGLMENIRLVDEYAHCSGDLKSAVDQKDLLKSEKDNISSKYDTCVQERDAKMTQAQCDIQIDGRIKGMKTEQQCTTEINSAKAELNLPQIIFALSAGLLGMFFYMKNRTIKGPKTGLEDFERVRRYRKD